MNLTKSKTRWETLLCMLDLGGGSNPYFHVNSADDA